jgi:hypothetical protein
LLKKVKSQIFIIIGIVVFVALGKTVKVLFAEPHVQATDSVDEIWNEPLNLSQSGAAVEPQMVVDSNNGLHVIWREDSVGSFFYTREEGGIWQKPIALDFPFGIRGDDTAGLTGGDLYSPKLLADRNGRIHAFWLGEDNVLFTSSVVVEALADINSWSVAQQLAPSAVNVAVTVDDRDNIHLSYIQDIDNPEASAGIYYRKMDGQDLSWSQAVPIYESAYYRALSPNNSNIGIAVTNTPLTDTVNISDTINITETVAITGTTPLTDTENAFDNTNVFIVGDNRLIEQVFASHSVDEGQSWPNSLLVDARTDEDSEFSVGPSQISIVIMGDLVHLVWRAGHETNCELYHQWSLDLGVTWEARSIIPSGQQGCPDKYELLSQEKGLLFLLAFWDDQAYLRAWDGFEWSEPQIQPPLTEFVDPVTNRQVNLDCQQTAVTQDSRLMVVGCGTGPIKDVWLLERPLQDESFWFPEQEAFVWSEPELLLDTSEEHFVSPIFIPGSENLLHVFWIGVDNLAAEAAGAKVYYSQWDGDVWSRPVPLLSLDMSQADRLKGVLDGNGRIFLMWRNPQTNAYFSRQVAEQRVLIPADWSTVIQLIEPEGIEGIIDSPDIYLDSKGEPGVVYARPLNENRGVYLIPPQELLTEQPEQITVFDAVAADWQMAADPRVVQTANGASHALFTRYEFRSEPRATSLYYSILQSGADTWSEPESIAEGNIAWSQLVNLQGHAWLIIWQQIIEEQTNVYARQSIDGGFTWEPSTLVFNSNNSASQPVLTVDDFNQVHLLQMYIENNTLTLQERSWQGGSWGMPESYIIFEDAPMEITLTDFVATAFQGNHLSAAHIIDQYQESTDENFSRFFNTMREFDIPESVTIPQIEIENTIQPTPTTLPTPTAEPEFVPNMSAPEQNATGNNTAMAFSLPSLLLISIGPVILLVIIVFGLRVGIRKFKVR